MNKPKTVLRIEFVDKTLTYYLDLEYGRTLHRAFSKIAVSDEPQSAYTGLFKTVEHWYLGFLYPTWIVINNEKIEVYVLEFCPYLIGWRVEAAYLRFERFKKWYK